jgi:hypothetical protein
MNPTGDPTNKNRAPAPIGMTFVWVGGEVGCVTLVIVLLAVFGGLWLDRLLGTRPLLTVMLVLLSAPLSLVITFWIAKNAVQTKNTTLPPQAGLNSNMKEGDQTGE